VVQGVDLVHAQRGPEHGHREVAEHPAWLAGRQPALDQAVHGPADHLRAAVAGDGVLEVDLRAAVGEEAVGDPRQQRVVDRHGAAAVRGAGVEQ
jgi:hypothetical protein